MHLLQSNVDLSMIRSWLGHASIEITNGYVEIDLEMKRKTPSPLKNCFPQKANAVPLGNGTVISCRGFRSCSYVR